MEVVCLISEGVTDAEQLVRVIHGRTINRCGRGTILGALTGVVSEVDANVIRLLREEVELAQRHKDECVAKMEQMCRECFPQQLSTC